MTETGYPPGPRMPALLQSFISLKWPNQFFEGARKRYGDCFTVKLQPFGKVVYVGNPTAIQELFRADPRLVHAGEAYAVIGDLTGHRSVGVLDEEEHLNVRRHLLPAFHGDLSRYEDMVREVTLEHMALWPVGQRMKLLPRLQALSLDVIMRIVFGTTLSHRVEPLLDLIPRVFESSPFPFVYPRTRIDLGRWSPWGRYKRLYAGIDNAIYSEMDARVSREQAGEADLLTTLMAARDENGEPLDRGLIRDQLVTTLVAGSETTGSSLSWTLSILSRRPEILERLMSHLEEGDETYLTAVLSETLRYRPIVMETFRKLVEPIELCGYRIPAGTVIMPSILLTHGSEHYDSPDEFRPARFLNAKLPSEAWIPFGGGVRRCLGASFSQFEMRVVMRTLLERVHPQPVSSKDETGSTRALILVPSRGAELVLRPGDRERAGDALARV